MARFTGIDRVEARAQGRTKGLHRRGGIFHPGHVGLYQTALDVKDWLTDASRLPMSELLLQGNTNI